MSGQSSAVGDESLNIRTPSLPSIYDTILCREPADDLSLLIRNGPDEYTSLLRTLQRSAEYFAERDNNRTVERLKLEMARLHMHNEQWERAARVLVPLWQALSWRRSGWWRLLDEIDSALSECAIHVKDYETLIGVNWELSNSSLTPRQDQKQALSYNITNVEARPKAILRAENVLSCITATFGFCTGQGHVGEPLSSQLILSSRMQRGMAPITVSKIKIGFEGSLKDLIIKHDEDKIPEASTTDGFVTLYGVSVENQFAASSSTHLNQATSQNQPLVGFSDLRLAPSQRRCLSFDHIPRNAEDVEVSSISLYIEEEEFDIEVIITEDEQMMQPAIWVHGALGLIQKPLKAARSNLIKILPKPPKLIIEIPDLKPIYFADETILLDLLVTNTEEEAANVSLDVRIVGPPGQLIDLKWASSGEVSNKSEESPSENTPLEERGSQFLSNNIESLARSACERSTFCMRVSSHNNEYHLEVRANYHLLSDPETPITKSLSAQLIVERPFDASYVFSPLLSLEPWPSYFDIDGLDNSLDNADERAAKGLTQRWSLTARLSSLANVPLTIDAVQLRVIEIHENAICKILSLAQHKPPESSIAPKDIHERNFIVEAQKIDLEDRQATFLASELEISWRRESSAGPSMITRLALPELVIPFGEPRVLAFAQNGESPLGVIHLDYTIENPSMYTLNFELTMETSEEFAFSGIKNVSVQLVPLSRHTIRYNIMPLVRGEWITPQFRVFDTHFRKTLKVNATEGMRTEPKGAQIWVDMDE